MSLCITEDNIIGMDEATGNMTCEIRCEKCHTLKSFTLTQKQVLLLFAPDRPLIQEILPALSRADRELFMTATCGPCFTAIFAEEEED